MGKIEMFHPHVSDTAAELVSLTLKSKMIGQGPNVFEFEQLFEKMMNAKNAVSVNSGTSALSLAYHLADIQPGDEVLVPVLTCAATNVPLLHMGAKLVFVDVDRKTLCPSKEDILKKITPKTKAIVNVHLHGHVNQLGKLPIPIIGDMAQCHRAPLTTEKFSCYSFQAIKHITTGDGGMLVCRNTKDYNRSKKLRWFGIDRDKKSYGHDTFYKEREMTLNFQEPGWKYHMNDIAAAIGIANLIDYPEVMAHHWRLEGLYTQELQGIKDLEVIGGSWGFPVLVERRDDFCKKLKKYGIETNVIHIRNDIIDAFGGERQDLPNMNEIEDKYIYLPLHSKVTEDDVKHIAKVIRSGW